MTALREPILHVNDGIDRERRRKTVREAVERGKTAGHQPRVLSNNLLIAKCLRIIKGQILDYSE